MTTYQFHFPASASGTVTITLPDELRDRDIDISVKAHDRGDDSEWTKEDEERRQRLIELLNNAPVMSDEEYNEWLETRKWINESVAAREDWWNDPD